MNETGNQSYYIVPKCEKEVRILYQDTYLLVVDKPEFLLTVPGRAPENKDCVITRLQQQFPEAVIVHRLDLDTSGLLIVPIQRSAMSHIARQFQERKIKKRYEAIVWGNIQESHGRIALPLKADWANRPKQQVDFANGKQAITDYSRLSVDAAKNQTRLNLFPLTGRSHQLRLHCRELGHPILGCDMYAHQAALSASSRLLLHACEIQFEHPHHGKVIQVSSAAPF